KLNIDYLFYITNQIMKPSIQFLEKMVVQPQKIFDACIIREVNKRNHKLPMSYYLMNKNSEIKNNDTDTDNSDNDSDNDNDNNKQIQIRWDTLLDNSKDLTKNTTKPQKKKIVKRKIQNQITKSEPIF